MILNQCTPIYNEIQQNEICLNQKFSKNHIIFIPKTMITSIINIYIHKKRIFEKSHKKFQSNYINSYVKK